MPTQAQLDELDAIIALLKEHPERHKQDSYAVYVGETPPAMDQMNAMLDCGSAFCIAGAAVVRAGKGVRWILEWIDSNRWYAIDTATITDPKGYTMSIWQAARVILGLSSGEADELFNGGNTMEDIERIRASLRVTEGTAE